MTARTPKTLATLKATTRQLADLETTLGGAPHVTDAELVERINEGIEALYDLLLQARGQPYYQRERSVETVVGQNDYALPDDFYQLLGVRAYDGSRWAQLSTWEPLELAALAQYQTNGGTCNVSNYRYRLQGIHLNLRPAATVTTHTLFIDYIPVAPRLSSDDQSLDPGMNGWEKYACYLAAADVARKDENTELAGSLMASAQLMAQRIMANAGSRDASRPARIQDTRGDWPRGRRRYSEGE